LRKTSGVIQMTMYLIQSELKAPKGQFNSFGKYNYRSCEDIVEAVKPLLAKYKYHLNMSDEVIGVGNRVYIKATCRVMEGDKVIAESSALAREAEIKKGMDDSQITGTASSYARKYALNGLFAIDDTKDADTDAHRHQQVDSSDLINQLNDCKTIDELQNVYKQMFKQNQNNPELLKQITTAKDMVKSKLGV
jgi:hypothetical protein